MKLTVLGLFFGPHSEFGLSVILLLRGNCEIADYHGRFAIFPLGGNDRILQFYWLKKFPLLIVIG